MSIYKVSAVVIVLIALGKISGFLKDILLTYHHGVSEVTDAFFLTSSISSVLYMAIFSSIPIVVIPLCTKARKSIDSELNKTISRVFAIYLTLSFLFSLFLWQFSPQLVEFFSGELNEESKQYSVKFLPIMAASFIFSAAVSFLNSIQLSQKKIIPSYITPILCNFVFCFGLTFFNEKNEFYMVLILGVLSWILLMVINMRSAKGILSIRFLKNSKSKDYLQIVQMALPAILALYIDQVNNVVSIFFSAKIGDGAVTIMNYGNKLNGFLLTIFIVVLTTIIFPTIADKVSANKRDELVNYILKYLKIFIFVGFPIVISVSLFSKEIVSIIFQRGEFGNEAAIDVSAVFRVVVIGLVLNLIRDLINRIFFAYSKSSIVMYFSLVAMLANLVLSYLWYSKYGLIGLAVAGVVSLLLNVFCLLYSMGRLINNSFFIPIIRIVVTFTIGGGVAVLFFIYGEGLELAQFSRYLISLIFYFSIIILVTILLNDKLKHTST